MSRGSVKAGDEFTFSETTRCIMGRFVGLLVILRHCQLHSIFIIELDEGIVMYREHEKIGKEVMMSRSSQSKGNQRR